MPFSDFSSSSDNNSCWVLAVILMATAWMALSSYFRSKAERELEIFARLDKFILDDRGGWAYDEAIRKIYAKRDEIERNASTSLGAQHHRKQLEYMDSLIKRAKIPRRSYEDILNPRTTAQPR